MSINYHEIDFYKSEREISKTNIRWFYTALVRCRFVNCILLKPQGILFLFNKKMNENTEEKYSVNKLKEAILEVCYD